MAARFLHPVFCNCASQLLLPLGCFIYYHRACVSLTVSSCVRACVRACHAMCTEVSRQLLGVFAGCHSTHGGQRRVAPESVLFPYVASGDQASSSGSVADPTHPPVSHLAFLTRASLSANRQDFRDSAVHLAEAGVCPLFLTLGLGLAPILLKRRDVCYLRCSQV